MRRQTADLLRGLLLVTVAVLALLVAYQTPAAIEVGPAQDGPVCPAPEPDGSYR